MRGYELRGEDAADGSEWDSGGLGTCLPPPAAPATRPRRLRPCRLRPCRLREDEAPRLLPVRRREEKEDEAEESSIVVLNHGPAVWVVPSRGLGSSPGHRTTQAPTQSYCVVCFSFNLKKRDTKTRKKSTCVH